MISLVMISCIITFLCLMAIDEYLTINVIFSPLNALFVTNFKTEKAV